MSDDYQIEVILSIERLDAIRTFWESIQWHPGADFDFFKVVLQNRKDIISPCVFVIRLNGKPATLLIGRIETAKMPIRLGYAELANLSVKRLVIIEGGVMGQCDAEAWHRVLPALNHILDREQLHLILFEQVKRDSPEECTIVSFFGRTRISHAHTDAKHWLMRLPESWEEFLKSRSKKHRYWLKRLANVLDRDFPKQWSISCFRAPEETEQFVRLAEIVAAKTYHRRLGVGFRHNIETLRRIHLEACRGALRGYVLFIKGEPKAFWYCLQYQHTLFLAATGYDPSVRQYELGTVLLMKVFEDHCGTSARMVDFGLGDAGYKERFGTSCFMENSLLLFSGRARGIWLKLVHTILLWGNRTLKTSLDKMRLTQRLKTIWRRGKVNQVARLAETKDALTKVQVQRNCSHVQNKADTIEIE